MRGFRRVNPTSDPLPKQKDLPKTAKPTTSGPAKPATTPRGPPSPPTTDPASASASSDRVENETRNTSNNIQTGKYCHYFVNQGWCKYEERTGMK